ncbi:thiolase family protein [Brachybacterium sacelli]|uniref:Acetyl-CoA acyltransferase n=1 Tax=Brachybacterium sacelli TaxID=173364 RepID=A0ABS4X641_9MICO|nr:thiolase family protein [Brachybacterium sacelli]MBP2383931.1 acetyl-CoA acyltransferase [Brachybacterium sacelli]
MSAPVIVDVVRTASGKGKPGGALSTFHPVDLLSEAITALVDRNDLDPAAIDDVLIGCLGQVGEQSVNIARNAALAAGLPVTTAGVTIDRQCGSGLQAVSFAAAGVTAGLYDAVIAGGVEMMSKVPINHATLGEDPFGSKVAERFPGGLVGQGVSAEIVAQRWNLDRDSLDEYSAGSHARAAAAAARGAFDDEIIPVTAPGSEAAHRADETVRPGTSVDALAGLEPVFRTDEMVARFPQLGWVITPGNSSPLTDGASAILLMSEELAGTLGLRPRARIVSHAVVGSDPIEMLTGVIPATRRVLERAGLTIGDMDAYEVNEAFAPVPLAWARGTGADPALLNQRGGAIALGHALGSSGTRLLATLLTQLEESGARFGLETICEGQGMANALIIERL